MSTRGDRRFAAAVVECEFLQAEAIEACLADHRERQRAGQGISLEQLLIQQGWLTPQQVYSLEEMIGRRVHFCPHCAKRVNLIESPPGLTVRCPGCRGRIVVPSPIRREDGSFAETLATGDEDAGPEPTRPGDTSQSTPVAEDDVEHLAGPRPFGRYTIEAEVSRGGMGVVYRARDPVLDRIVALKVLLGGGEDEDRFVKEAEAIARIDHPYIIRVFDAGCLNGRCYYAMEYVDGKTISELVAERGAFPPSESAAIAASVAQALSAIHRAGLIHRDLKPANILVDSEGRPRIIDFGIAKDLRTLATLTESGTFIGTPNYMAPEQVSTELGPITERTDVYALGGVLYHLLTGLHPFGGDSPMHILVNVLKSDIRPPRLLDSRIDPGLEAICLKALAKEPLSRYESSTALGADLDAWLRGDAIAARPVTRSGRFGVWWRRERSLVLASLLLSLVPAVLFALAARRESGQTGERREAAARLEAQIERARVSGSPAAKLRQLHGRWLDATGHEARSRAAWEELRKTYEDEAAAIAGKSREAREAGRFAEAAVLLSSAMEYTPDLLGDGSREPGPFERLRSGMARLPDGSWGTPGQLREGGLSVRESVAYATGDLESLGLSGKGGVAYSREDLACLGVPGTPGTRLFAHRGKALTPAELAALGLAGRISDGRVFSAEELDALNRASASPRRELYGAGGIVYTLEDLQVLDLFGIAGRAYRLQDLESVDLYGYRGRALSFEEVVRRELFAVGRRAQSADQLALAGLFGREGRAWKAAELRERGWFGRAGRAYALEELEAADLYGRDGVATTASEIPEGFFAVGRLLLSREAVEAGGYVLCGGRALPLDLFLHPAGTLAGHEHPVRALAFSPKGETLLSLDESGTAIRWRLPFGERIGGAFDLAGPAARTSALAWHTESGRIAAGDEKGGVFLHEPTAPGEAIVLAELTGSAVLAIAWTGDARTLFVAGADGRVRVFRHPFLSRSEPATFQAHEAEVASIAASPDGRVFATGGADGSVRLWSAKDLVRLRESPRLPGRVSALAWAGESELGALVRGGKLLVLSSSDLAEVSRIDRLADRSAALALAGGGRILVAAGDKPAGEIVFHELAAGSFAAGREVARVPSRAGRVDAIAIGPGTSESWLAAGHSDGRVTLWRLRP